MSSRIASVPGTVDLFPEESARRTWIESTARTVFERYGYGEIRTPIFERTELFSRSIGESTDIVRKEMYTFEDRGGRSLTLRPEGTASVVRAVLGRGIGQNAWRLYYMGAMLRNERPQKGRLRQFHQIGVEAIGRVTPATDAEIIVLLMDLLEAVGLGNLRLRVNSIGGPGDRPRILEAYRAHFGPRLGGMCEDCARRYETNVLRILDCKREGCQEAIEAAPSVVEIIGPEARERFREVLTLLRAAGLEPEEDPRLVRGLDYYLDTVYEVAHPGLGAQDAIAGGGRYRISFGEGETVEGSGFALGVERLLLALDAEGKGGIGLRSPDVYLVSAGRDALPENFRLARQLRRSGLLVRMDLEGRSVKAQMRAADRSGARWVVVRGEDEIGAGTAVLREMESGREWKVPVGELAMRLKTGRRRTDEEKSKAAADGNETADGDE